MKFTLPHSAALNIQVGDYVVFKFPATLPWTATNTSPPTLPNPDRTGCVGGDAPGLNADYVQFITSSYSLIIYKSASAIITNSAVFCFNLQTFNYKNSGSMLIYASSSQRLAYYDSTLNVEAVTNAFTLPASVTEKLMDTAVAPAGQRALYEFAVATLTEIPVSGSISILFPSAKFSSVDPTCFRVGIAGSQVRCSSESSYTYSAVSYFRFLVTGWTAALVPGTYTFQVFATPSTGSTTANILGFSSRDLTSAQLMDVSTSGGLITLTGETVLTSASVNPFVTPKLTLRTAQTGPLSFLLTPSTTVPPSTSSTVYGYVEITLPSGSSASLLKPDFTGTTLTVPTGGNFFMECSFTTIAVPRVVYPASRCEYSTSVVKAYTPQNLSLTSPNTYLLTVSPVDDSIGPDGFLAGAAGYLQLKIKTASDSAALESAEPWVYIPPATSFKNVNVASYSRHAGEFTALYFSLKLTTAVNGGATPAGVLLIEFPYAGTGSGWAANLGTGKATGAELDCKIDSGSAAAFSAAKCYLLEGAIDYARVKIAGFGAAAIDDALIFTLAGIKNPVNVPSTRQYDLKLNLMSATWTLDTPVNFYTVLDWSAVDYIDTISTLTTPTATTVTTPMLTGNSYGLTAASVTLTITPATNPSGGDMVFVMLQSDYPLTGQTPICTYGGTTAQACIYFAASGYLLVTLANSPTAGAQPLIISPLTMPSYSSKLSIKTYLYVSRKIDAITTHEINPAMAIPTTLGVVLDLTLLGKVKNTVDNYCFKFTPTSAVQTTQAIEVAFPVSYTIINAGTCAVSPRSNQANLALNIACKATANVLIISSFPAVIAQNTDLEVCVTAKNPDSATQQQPFNYYVYVDTDPLNAKGVEKLQDTTGVTLTAAPTPAVLSVFNVGYQYKAARDVIRTPTDVVAPLVLTLKLPNALNAGFGQVTVTIKGPTLAPTLAANGVERCVWKTGADDYISETCTYAAGPPGVFTIKAPGTYTILSSTDYTLTLTTLGGAEEGLVWTEKGLYTVDLSFSAAEGTPLSPVGRGRTYFRVGPASIANLSVSVDHATAGYFSRYVISFKGPTALISTSGGRIAIEFPGMFDAFQGSTVDQHMPISCSATGLTAISGSLVCYLQKGNSDLGLNPTVIVTNFNAVLATDNPVITLNSIKNPSVAGDDKIVWMRVSILDISAGWPGDVSAQRKLENLFTVQAAGSILSYSTDKVILSVTTMGDTTSIYTFQIKAPSGLPANGDLVYLTLSEKMTLFTLNPDTLTCSDCSSSPAIVYFPSVKTAILTVGTGGYNITVNIGPFEILNYQPTSAEFTYKGVYIRGGNVIGMFTSDEPGANEPFSIKTGSSITVTRSDGLTAFYQQDNLDWRFTFTPSVKIPAGGGIIITTATSTFNDADGCYNDKGSGSSLTGGYTCRRETVKTIVLTVLALQLTGSPIMIIANVKNVGLTEDTVVIKTLSNAINTTKVMEEFIAFKVSFNAAIAIESHNVPLQVKFHNYVRAGQVGSFSFTVKLPADLTADTYLAKVTFPFTVTVAVGGTLQCLWITTTQQLAKSCSLDATTFKIATVNTPPAVTLTSGTTYTVVMTSSGATSPEAQGLTYPAAGNHDIKVELCKTNTCTGPNLIITGTERLTVLPNQLFKSFSVLYGNNNAGLQNFIQFKFTVNVAITTLDGYFELHFPTKDSLENTLFITNLGINVPSGSDIKCQLKATIAVTSTCLMTYGDAFLDRPVIVKVKPSANVAANEAVTISFERIINPAVAGDDRHVSLTLISYEGAAAQEAQTYFNVFTVNTAPTETLGATTAPVLNALAVPGGSATITITLPTVVGLTSDTGIYLMSIPFTMTGMTFTGTGFIFPDSNTFVYISTSPTTANVVFSYAAIPYLPIGAVITITYMLNGTKINTTTMAAIPIGGALTPTLAATLTAKFDYFATAIPGQYGYLKLSYSPPSLSIPAGGCVQYKLTEVNSGAVDQTTTVDPTVCTVSYDNVYVLPSTAYRCKITQGDGTNKSAVISITGLAGATTNPVNAIIRTSLTNSLKVEASVYFKYTSPDVCQYTLKIATPLILAKNIAIPPTSLSFEPLQVVPKVSLGGGKGDLVFKFKFDTTLTFSVTSYLLFSPSAAFVAPAAGVNLVCDITSATARIGTLCSFDTATIPNIKVYPQAELTSGVPYTVKLTTNGAAQGANGLTLPAAGNKSIQMTTYEAGTLKDVGVFYYSLPTASFSSLKITPAHVSAGLYNIFKIEYTSLTAVTGNVLVVEFPVLAPDHSTSTLFDEDLGTSRSTGQSVPCSESTLIPVVCTLRKGNIAAFVPAQVRMTGAVPLGATIVYIGGVKNPACATSSGVSGLNIVMRVFIESAAGVVIEDRSVDHTFWLDCTTVTPSATIASAWKTSAPSAGGVAQVFEITGTPLLTVITTVSWIVINENYSNGPFLLSTTTTPTVAFSNVYDSTKNFDIVWKTTASPYELGNIIPPNYKAPGSHTSLTVYIIGTRGTNSDNVVLDFKAAVPASGVTGDMATGATLTGVAITPQYMTNKVMKGAFHIYTVTYKPPATKTVPGAYVFIQITGGTGATFDAYDETFLQLNSPYKGTTKFSVKANGFLVYGETLSEPNGGGSVNILARATAQTTPKVTITVYLDSQGNKEYGSAIAIVPTISTITDPLENAAIAMTPTPKLNVPITGISITFKPTSNVLVTDPGLTIDFVDTRAAFTCVQAATCTLNTVACATITLAAATIVKQGNQLDAGNTYIAAISISTTGCIFTLAGYSYALMTLDDSTANNRQALIRLYVAGAAFTSFTMETFSASVNYFSTVKISYNPGVGGLLTNTMLEFSFPQAASGSNTFPPYLDLKTSSGSLVSAGADVPYYSSEAVSACYILPGGLTSEPGIYAPILIRCLLNAAVSVGTVGYVFFPKIKNPSTAFTAKFNLKAYTNGQVLVQESDDDNQTAFDATSCTSFEFSGTNSISPSSQVFGAAATYPFSIDIKSSPTRNAYNGDYFTVVLGSNFDLANTPTGFNGAGVLMLINSPYPCPCVIAPFISAGEEPNPNFSIQNLKNPTKSGPIDIVVYPGIIGVTSTRTCYAPYTKSVNLSAGALTALTVTNQNTPSASILYPNEDTLFTVVMTLRSTLPKEGSIEITFPSSHFQGLSEFAAISTGLSGASYLAAGEVFTISGQTSALLAGTTITITGLYVQIKPLVAGSVNVTATTKNTTGISATPLDSLATPLVISAVAKYLRTAAFYTSSPAVLYQPTSDAHTASGVKIVMNFKIPTALKLNAGTVALKTSGSAFTSTATIVAYFTTGTTSYKAKSTAIATDTITVTAPQWVDFPSANVDCTLTISAGNNNVDGLVFAPTSSLTGVDVLISDLQGTPATYTTLNTYMQGATSFTTLTVEAFSNQIPTPLPFKISFKPTVGTTLTALSIAPELVIQFPHQDNFGVTVFPATVFDSSVTGWPQVGCRLYAGTTLVAVVGVVCRFYPGSILDKTHPSQVVVSNTAVFAATTTYTLILPPVTLPAAAGTAVDITVFTRNVLYGAAADQYQINDFQVVRNVLTSVSTVLTTATANWPTLAPDNNVLSTGVVYTLNIAHSGISASLIKFPSPAFGCTELDAVIGTAKAGAGAAGGTYYSLAPYCMAWIVGTALSTDATEQYVLTGVSNPRFKATLTQSTLIVYTAYAGKVTETSLTQSPASPLWVALGGVFNPVLAVNTYQTTDSYYTPLATAAVFKDHNGYYKLTFNFLKNVPAGAAFSVTFPTGYTVGTTAIFAVSGANLMTCTGDATARSWTCTAPATTAITTPTIISISGRAKSPSVAGATTDDFILRSYYDSTTSYLVTEKLDAGKVTVTDVAQFNVPDDFYVPLQVEFMDIPVRSAERGVLIVEFKPAFPLKYSISPRLVAVQETSNTAFKYTPTPGTGDQAICMFVDMSSNIQYRASSCTSNGLGAFTARAPLTKIIDIATWWRLVITTAGLEKQVAGVVTSNGLDFPDMASFPNKRYTLKLTIEGGKNCEESLYITGPAPTAASIKLISVNKNYPDNIYFLKVDAAIASGDYFSLVFPAKINSVDAFTFKLGTGHLGTDYGCYDSTAPAGNVVCTVVSHGFVYTGSRSSRMEMTNVAFTAGTPRDIAILGITNPANAVPLWMDFQVHTTAGELKYFTRLQYVAQISGTTAVGASTPRASLAMGNLAVTAVAQSFKLSTGVVIPDGGYAYVKFTEDINSAATLTSSIFKLLTKKIIIVKNATGGDLTQLDLADWTNPSFMPTTPSVTVTIFNALSLYSADNVFPLTYTANVFTTLMLNDAVSAQIIDDKLHGGPMLKYSIKFKYSVAINSGDISLFRFTFPGATSKTYGCEMPTPLATNADGNKANNVVGEDLCDVSGARANFYLYGALLTGSNYIVNVWAKLDPASGTVLTGEVFSDFAGNSQKGYSTATTPPTVLDYTAPTTLSILPYLQYNPKTVLRGNAIDDLTATLSIPVALTAKTGKVELLITSAQLAAVGTVTAPYRLVGLWTSAAGTTYLASSCALATNTITVNAPASGIAIGTWTIRVTSTMTPTVPEGIQYAAASELAVTVKTYGGTGSTLDGQGSAVLRIPPAQFAALKLTSYSRTADKPTFLQLDFTATTSLATAGIGAASGDSEIVLTFSRAAFDANLGLTVINPTDHYSDQTDCVALTALAGVKCYVRKGFDTNDPEYVLRGYAAPLAAPASLLIGPIYSLSAGNKVVHVNLTARSHTAGVWSTKAYVEFRNVYMTVVNTVDTTVGTITAAPSPNVPAASVSLTFAKTVALGKEPATANSGMILFFVGDTKTSLAGAAAADGTLYSLPLHRFLLFFPTLYVTSQAITGLTNNSYSLTQIWTWYIYASGLLSYSSTVTNVITPTATITGTAAFLVGNSNSLAFGSNHPNLYTIYFKTTLAIPLGGEIRVTIPTMGTPTINNCRFEGPLTGAATCSVIMSTMTVKITGFSAIAGAVCWDTMTLQQVMRT